MASGAESLRADDAMRSIYESLHERVGTQKYNAWFKHGTRLSLEDEHVSVAVPNPFVANWIESHYRSDIAEVVEAHTGLKRRVSVTIDPELVMNIRKRDLDSQADIVQKTCQGRARFRDPAPSQILRYDLKDFVVGESNKLAYSAALAMAGEAKPAFNPLFIHGVCGVGKTHILQGVCSQVSRMRRKGRPFTWKYVTGEQFTNEFIQSLRGKKVAEFRQRYRQLDVLAIDDVHFLAAKKATQDEFLHTFNAIESAGNRVVMASDAHPRLVGDLNEQLRSRFMSGMVVKVDAPDPVTRLSIVTRRARILKLKVSKQVLEYIASHIQGSVREAEGTLIKLAALSALDNTEVTLEMARSVLADHLVRTDSVLTLGSIESVVSAFFGITPPDIHSSRRTKTVSVARMVTIFLARRHTQMSYPEIARAIGKNHSSAVLAVQRMDKILAGNADLTWNSPMGSKSINAAELLDMLSGEFL